MGFLAGSKVKSFSALHRLHNAGGDYIEDTSPDAYTSQGYTDDGVLGYVP